MRASVDAVSEIAPGVWEGHLTEDEIHSLGNPTLSYGATSILLMLEAPQYSESNRSLSFRLGATRTLNRGSGPRVIFVASNGGGQPPGDSRQETTGEPARVTRRAYLSPEREPAQISSPTATKSPGDSDFLKKLPQELQPMGEALLSSIRKWHRGNLVLHPKSQRYVETPNFWTVRIQPRNLDLRITVYGNPQDHSALSLDLKPDQASYTSFLLKSLDQVDEAVQVIRKAKELKDKRATGS